MRLTDSCRKAMFDAVLGTCSEFTSVINRPAFTAGLGELQKVSDRISVVVQDQARVSGATAERVEALTDLGDQAFLVASALKSYAATVEDVELEMRSDFSRTEVTKGRASTVAGRCQNICDEADEIVDELEDYGVTAATLTTLQKAVTRFTKAGPKPRQAKARSGAATRQLPPLFRKATRILRKRLDPLIVQFKETNPDFYNAYKKSRKIVHRRAGSAKDPAAKAA